MHNETIPTILDCTLTNYWPGSHTNRNGHKITLIDIGYSTFLVENKIVISPTAKSNINKIQILQSTIIRHTTPLYVSNKTLHTDLQTLFIYSYRYKPFHSKL